MRHALPPRYPYELSERKQDARKHFLLKKVSHLELGRRFLLENTDENLEATVSMRSTQHIQHSAKVGNKL